MSGVLSPDVIAAINKVAATPLGRKYDRMARAKYKKSGVALAAKEIIGESGGRMDAKSSAGAKGLTQFIPSTRDSILKQSGYDAYGKKPSQAIQAMEFYQLQPGVGVAGYNPGMPSYTDYILNQKLDPTTNRALKRNGSAGDVSVQMPGKTSVTLPTTTIPGQSLAPQRNALRDSLFLGGGKLTMQGLLNYKQQLDQLQDVPEQKVTGDLQVKREPGKDVTIPGSSSASQAKVPGTSRTLDQMFKVAGDIDKLNNQGKVPYAWGGGHGSKPAKIGEAVDCSGFVSQVLGIAPRVSGNFQTSWGKPGRGKSVTVYANPTHVLIAMKDPRTNKVRWFATSRTNPGGGAGEIAKPSAAYLAKFTARQPG